ncbi:hypothetical protein ACKW6Q_04085 [Chryseobacterium kwangjuense]|uniref:Lipoprotein n=1 Tax=Chryseobacterium kwangjuense TaxID=267125 RepID=A0ABW9JYI3_9FLAO
MACSCTSQKKNDAYIQEIDHQVQLLDSGTGLKKETIILGIGDGVNDRTVFTVSLIYNPGQPGYIKIEKKINADYTYNNQFYYRNKKLVKAKINRKNNTNSENSESDYSVEYYLQRNSCIRTINEDPEKSDCRKIKADSETALLDVFPLLPKKIK